VAIRILGPAVLQGALSSLLSRAYRSGYTTGSHYIRSTANPRNLGPAINHQRSRYNKRLLIRERRSLHCSSHIIRHRGRRLCPSCIHEDEQVRCTICCSRSVFLVFPVSISGMRQCDRWHRLQLVHQPDLHCRPYHLVGHKIRLHYVHC
jgi:hypothetical protein